MGKPLNDQWCLSLGPHLACDPQWIFPFYIYNNNSQVSIFFFFWPLLYCNQCLHTKYYIVTGAYVQNIRQ